MARIQTAHRSIRRAWKVLLLAGVMLGAFALTPAATARAQGPGMPPAEPEPPGIVLVPGTVPFEEELAEAVSAALNTGIDLFPELHHFAITDVRQSDDWALVSVIGLAQVHDGLAWGINDGAWFGLVLLQRAPPGSWLGAVQGTPEFSALLDGVPDSFIEERARRDLDPGQRVHMAGETYIFPWQAGTSMYYGFLGVHDNGFSFGEHVGWKAVDMLSDGNTAAGHAPNRLLAAAGGTISYKCTDPNNVAILLGDFFYTHLVDNAGLQVGLSFVQGSELGQMKVGTFGTQGLQCGWAQQSDGWFHVHWGFANADLHVEDWTLSMSTQNWTNGTTTVTPGGGWITATGLSLPHISGNTGVGGARLSYDVEGPQSVNADANGAYSIQVPEGWSGSITPSLPGYRFDPPMRTYDSVDSNQIAQDYAARALAQPRPASGQVVCNPVGIGVDLLLTEDTRTANGDLDASTFLLRVDGVNVTSQAATRVQSTAPAMRAALVYTPPALAAGEHTASFRYDDLGRTVNVNWTFMVQGAGCGELLTAPATDEASRSLTKSTLATTEDEALTGEAMVSGGSAPVEVEHTPRERLSGHSAADGPSVATPAIPTPMVQAEDAAPVLSGGPLACLPWGVTCPRTLLLKE